MNSYPRMKRPDNAGINRRLFDSRMEANANFAAVKVRNCSVVSLNTRCVSCKLRLLSFDVDSIPSTKQMHSNPFFQSIQIPYILNVRR